MASAVEATTPDGTLAAVFDAVDFALSRHEAAMGRGEVLPLPQTVEDAVALVLRLVSGYVAASGTKVPPAADADVLDAFKILVKGDPTWNAIRDNCRELVYYRNCINMGRRDALPQVPEKMAVRTARHVYLYFKTRCIREGRLAEVPAGATINLEYE
jgi:hypothetical protein